MKIDKKQAVILILCFAALLILGYVASKGYLNEAQNNATINESQTQNATNLNQTAGQTPEGNATNQTPAPSGNITNVSTNETPGGNITNLSYGPGTGITPPHPKPNQTNVTCSDTETLGECYFVAGTTTGSFNGTQGSYSDYCVGNVLHYYTCTYLSAGPVVNGTFICPINCSNGACATQTNTTNCTDSDNGVNPYLQGTTNTSSGNISSDYCINGSILMEYYCLNDYCLNDMMNGMEYNCLYGCSNGACATQTNTTNCTDSDNGVNPYLQGTTNTSSGNISSDYCINGSILMEYYCLNDMADGAEYICPDSCSNGACTFINMSNIYESDFMVVDDSMPNLLTNQKFFEMPPPPENNT